MSFIEFMHTGGAMMWMIFALSVVALAIAAERMMFFVSARGDAESHVRELESSHADAPLPSPKGSTSVDSLFRTASRCWSAPQQDLRAALDEEIRAQLFRWERRIGWLETIAKVAPLLGLLGTVLGMSDMFGELAASTGISSSAVTSGIWKALSTTIAGLSVAIPSMLIHSALSSRVDREEDELSRAAERIAEIRASRR